VALTSAGESGPVSIWAGWLDGDAPPVWQRIEDPHWTDLPWAPRTLELQGDWLYITRHSGESAADGAPVVERYRLTDEGLDLETTIPVPGLELPIGATVIADVLVVQDPYRLHFVSVSPDSDPTVLGSALYADGAISDPNWRDWNLVPRLTAIGERHFYVTAHPNAQVWTMP
jgi:hypothetical protein